MNCPVCETQMKEIEKYGVEIDICPQCKGVWLDRGEIDKIATVESNYYTPEVEHFDKKDHVKGKKKKKKGSFIGVLFEELSDF